MITTKSFEQYAFEPPEPVLIDLDSSERYVVIMRVSPGSGQFETADLTVRADRSDLPKALIGWLIDDQLRYSAPIGKGESLPLAVSAEAIKQMYLSTGDRRVTFGAQMSRRIGTRPAAKEVRTKIETQIFRSSWPAEAAASVLFANPALDVGDADGTDNTLVVGRIELRVPDDVALYAGPIARVRIGVDMGGATGRLGTSVRATDIFPADENGAPSELVWCTGPDAVAFCIPKIRTTGDLHLFSYEIGCDVGDLRRLLRDTAGAAGPLRAPLELSVNVAVVIDDSSTVLLEETVPLTVESRIVDRLRVLVQGKTIEIDLAGGAQSGTSVTMPPLLATLRQTKTESIEDFPRQLPVAFVYEGSWDPSCLEVSLEASLRTARGPFGTPWSKEIEFTQESQSIDVPIYRLLSAPVGDRGETRFPWSDAPVLRLEIGAKLRRPGAEYVAEQPLTIEVPIDVDDRMPGWLCCIDLGTSSTAISFARLIGSDEGVTLPLGEWLETIDAQHDESRAMMQSTVSNLLPSHIGLSAEIGLRPDHDPLSFGDLAAAGHSREAVLRRLESMDRRYEVSIPFPKSDRLHKYVSNIVFEPKKLLISSRTTLKLGQPILQRLTGGSPASSSIEETDIVDLADLMKDYFDELGRYIVPRVLLRELAADTPDRQAALLGIQMPTAPRPARRAVELARLIGELYEAWRDGFPNLKLVLTHPSGLHPSRKAMYRRAGEAFVRALTSDPSPEAFDAKKDILLVPEALAAARYGIQAFVRRLREEGRSAAGLHDFVALDVGAGTYDVTVIRAEIKSDNLQSWDIRAHWGLVVGGNDLDLALIARVLDILSNAHATPQVSAVFDFSPALSGLRRAIRPDGVDDESRLVQTRLLAGFRTAKARLTSELMSLSATSYRWSRGPAGNVPFRMLVGEMGDSSWPVRLRDKQQLEPRRQLRIAGERAWIEAVQLEGRRIQFHLCVEHGSIGWPAQDVRGGREINDLLALMGQELPRIAMRHVLETASGSGGQSTPNWIITGRAALWPALYETIIDTIESGGSEAGRPIQNVPFEASEMKRAVISGAKQLAKERHLKLAGDTFNPIAVVRFAPPLTTGVTERHSKTRHPVISIDYLQASSGSGGNTTLVIETDAALVRAIPGLSPDRLELFDRLGVRPWEVIANELPWRESKLEWERDGASIMVKMSPLQGGGLRTFGPIAEGTIYGSD